MPVCCQFAVSWIFFLFSMRMSSTLCWHSKVDLLGFPLISGGTTSFFSLASISFHQAEPVGMDA